MHEYAFGNARYSAMCGSIAPGAGVHSDASQPSDYAGLPASSAKTVIA
jgi:hypothetical protein